MKCLLLMGVLALATGCASSEYGAGVVHGGRVKIGGSMLIVAVDDYDEGDASATARNSGAVVAAALRRALKDNRTESLVAERAETLAQAFELAERMRCGHVVEARITGWHDAGVEWNQDPDRVELQVRVYETASRALVAYGHEQGRSGSRIDATETPHRLLSPLTREMLATIFRGEELEVDLPEDGDG